LYQKFVVRYTEGSVKCNLHLERKMDDHVQK